LWSASIRGGYAVDDAGLFADRITHDSRGGDGLGVVEPGQ